MRKIGVTGAIVLSSSLILAGCGSQSADSVTSPSEPNRQAGPEVAGGSRDNVLIFQDEVGFAPGVNDIANMRSLDTNTNVADPGDLSQKALQYATGAACKAHVGDSQAGWVTKAVDGINCIWGNSVSVMKEPNPTSHADSWAWSLTVPAARNGSTDTTLKWNQMLSYFNKSSVDPKTIGAPPDTGANSVATNAINTNLNAFKDGKQENATEKLYNGMAPDLNFFIVTTLRWKATITSGNANNQYPTDIVITCPNVMLGQTGSTKVATAYQTVTAKEVRNDLLEQFALWEAFGGPANPIGDALLMAALTDEAELYGEDLFKTLINKSNTWWAAQLNSDASKNLPGFVIAPNTKGNDSTDAVLAVSCQSVDKSGNEGQYMMILSPKDSGSNQDFTFGTRFVKIDKK